MSALSSGRFAVVPTRILEDSRLSDGAKVVYAMLATHSNSDGWCWPAQATIAKRVGKKRPAISKLIRTLVECGYIVIDRLARADGRPGANKYYLVYDGHGYPRAQDAGASTDETVRHAAASKVPPRNPSGSTAEPDQVPPGNPPRSTTEPTRFHHGNSHIGKNETKERDQRTNIDAALLQKFKSAYPATPHWTDVAVREALKKAISEGADFEEIFQGAVEYRDWCEANDWYSPRAPVGWVKSRQWTNFEPPVEDRAAALPPPLTQPEITTEQAAWWDNLRERALKAMGDAAFKSWFSQLVYDGTAIWAPSAFMRDWLRTPTNVPPEIEAALKAVPMKVGQPPSMQDEAAP